MNKPIELRKWISSLIKSVHPNVVVNGKSISRVHFQSAPDDAVTPYVVYDLPNSIDDGAMENFRLEIDGWDAPANGDSTALETLMDAIDKGLHRQTKLLPGQLSATFYRENRMSLLDDDEQIRRRKYIYQVRTHEGG